MYEEIRLNNIKRFCEKWVVKSFVFFYWEFLEFISEHKSKFEIN